jgi:hypothetical protein
MGSTHKCFWFVECVIESHMAINEGISACHYLVQSESYKFGYARSSSSYKQNDNDGNVIALKNRP